MPWAILAPASPGGIPGTLERARKSGAKYWSSSSVAWLFQADWMWRTSSLLASDMVLSFYRVPGCGAAQKSYPGEGPRASADHRIFERKARVRGWLGWVKK